MKNLYLFSFILFAFIVLSCDTEDVDPQNDLTAEELPTYIGEDLTLRNIFDDPAKADYTSSGLEVNDGAILTIEPGVVIEFGPNALLWVKSNSTTGIVAEGTAELPIIMRGANGNAGDWRGIYLVSSNTINSFDYVYIEDAGGASDIAGEFTALSLEGTPGARLSMTNSRISNSNGYGIVVEEGALFTDFSSNSLTENASYPILTNINAALALDGASDFSNNGTDAVELSIWTLSMNGTLSALNVPYHSTDMTIRADLTLEPGLTLLMKAGAFIWVTNDGTLSSVGTLSDQITIGGVESGAGYWEVIDIRANSKQNFFEYTTISGGGSDITQSGDRSNIYIDGSSDGAGATVSNCIISESSGYGIVVENGGTLNADAETINSFEGNAEGNVLRL